jgi:hypothetical protein
MGIFENIRHNIRFNVMELKFEESAMHDAGNSRPSRGFMKVVLRG